MNEKEIQSFQQQIDELNDLCSEAVSDSRHVRRNERLGVMILKMQDDRLEKRYVMRLEKWLLSDPEALDFYVDFAQLTAILQLHFHPEICSKIPASVGGSVK